MNREISAEEKPFLTRFFNEVLNNVEIPYKEFDFSKNIKAIVSKNIRKYRKAKEAYPIAQ